MISRLILVILIVVGTILLTRCSTVDSYGEQRPNTLPRDGNSLYPGQSPLEPDWTHSQPGNDYPTTTYYPYYIPLGY